MKTTSEQLEILGQGMTIHNHGEFVKKLNKGTPLRIKYGIDPTASQVHLGHAVGLLKLKQFQDLGHTVVLIIGDYTAVIGDPTGRDKTRKSISDAEILHNSQDYIEQMGKILNIIDCEVHCNSSWFEGMTFLGVINLMKNFTISQMIERNDFSIRMKNKSPVFLHECIYPIMQAYDSLMIHADVELGGTDQLFNLMLGRDMQKLHDEEQQSVITVPILRGIDGVRRMGKSLGNFIGLKEEPFEMYSRTMSIPDNLIEEWWTLLPLDGEKWNSKLEFATGPKGVDWMGLKGCLAYRLVKFFHNEELANESEEKWTNIFSRREIPDDAPEVTIGVTDIGLIDLLILCGLADSKNQARRHIVGGAVKVGSQKITDPHSLINVTDNLSLRVGKRHAVKLKIQ